MIKKTFLYGLFILLLTGCCCVPRGCKDRINPACTCAQDMDEGYNISIARLNYFIGRFEERSKCNPVDAKLYKNFIDSFKNNIIILKNKRK